LLSVSISGEILLDIFKTIDHYKVFDDVQAKGKTPFVFVDDAHDSSRF
jgi:hypothetical protein